MHSYIQSSCILTCAVGEVGGRLIGGEILARPDTPAKVHILNVNSRVQNVHIHTRTRFGVRKRAVGADPLVDAIQLKRRVRLCDNGRLRHRGWRRVAGTLSSPIAVQVQVVVS